MPAEPVIEELLPDPVTADLDGGLRSYWLKRAMQHTTDSYAGVRMSKFPEDLRVYEHLLWLSRANVVVEIGTQYGGSTLWLRDRLAAMVRYGRITDPRVIAIDIQIDGARKAISAVDPGFADTITLLEGDVCDPSVAARVTDLLAPEARCMVIEDSAHVYETTRAALDGFADLVPAGGFFVVEDGCVDIEAMRVRDDWPRGVLPALDAWLRTPAAAEFTVRRDLERYGLSCHPHGFLQRTGGGPGSAQT